MRSSYNTWFAKQTHTLGANQSNVVSELGFGVGVVNNTRLAYAP